MSNLLHRSGSLIIFASRWTSLRLLIRSSQWIESILVANVLMNYFSFFLREAKNRNMVILQSDKGGNTAILDRSDYMQKPRLHLSENVEIKNYTIIHCYRSGQRLKICTCLSLLKLAHFSSSIEFLKSHLNLNHFFCHCSMDAQRYTSRIYHYARS